MDKHLTQAAGMSAVSILQPLKPQGPGWQSAEMPDGELKDFAICVARWIHPAGYNVFSSVESVDDGHGEVPRPHFHISMTRLKKTQRGLSVERVDMNAAKWILGCFDESGFEEDNHVPGGKARNFWRPVADSQVGRECPCKATEPVIREEKGDYIWRPAD